ncbi:hypothetical protein [Arthrobacter sp. 35/47]|uniref:hypothetical protein n=1 Tax=Arthrobacter sp. 35/47 TaxID=269454 RepID=UPI000568ED63|nr:hypothetical protein [Arthrobacter sp. 35/47]
MANRRKERLAENLDILIGFLGFFAVVLVVVIITIQLRRDNAAMWSVALLTIVLSMWGLFKIRPREDR